MFTSGFYVHSLPFNLPNKSRDFYRAISKLTYPPTIKTKLQALHLRFQLSMAKTRHIKQEISYYTIKGTNQVIRVGDCVLMKSAEANKPPYVARVEKLEADSKGEMKVKVRWYYRPEEAIGGRRQFHGVKELFLSDHYDTQSANTIEGKCIVHSFRDYTKLDDVGAEDYFSRFEYKAITGAFTPDRVAVYCKCEMPYNPDELMLQCDECKDWYHPACVKMTTVQAKKLSNYLCDDCTPEQDRKNPPGQYWSVIIWI
ncbi:chromatin remodeling protein EBS-like isoform X3 [Apium graveolens]|uniref:chromatin remodeling protein EBS-like isoform X3 n=1 Tax=Apium graveolens TaxID=4045 RepID=UPI003D79B912